MPVLTEIEQQVIWHMAHGLDNAEIAKLQFKSPKTVKSQKTIIYRKLGARNASHAVFLWFGAEQMKLTTEAT